jgi:Protein of unknown function (DUF3800)
MCSCPDNPYGYRTVSGKEPAGDKMAKILYLDESGITLDEKTDRFLIVAGVLVDIDKEWRQVRDELQRVANDWLPPSARRGFVFHAKDIYHGHGFWDRDVWPSEVRNEVMGDLLAIIEAMRLPVVAHYIEKLNFGASPESPRMTPKFKNTVMHGTAAINCMSWADRWLSRFAPNENATVAAENRNGVQELIRAVAAVIKDEESVHKHGFSAVDHLPLLRIIDGITFQKKNEAVALQLADLCAFILMRELNGKHLPEGMNERFMTLFLATRMGVDDTINERVTKMVDDARTAKASSLAPSEERSS